jgi:hypothetical protein
MRPPRDANPNNASQTSRTANSGMTSLAERLDGQLHELHPEADQQLRQRI